MTSLVALDVAKAHLRITDTDHDAEVQRELDAATTIVVLYLAEFADPTWTEATLPADVCQAILILLGHLDESRGGMGVDPASDDDMEKTWKAIASILMRRRLPSIA